MNMNEKSEPSTISPKSKMLWMVYLALIVAAVLLLGDALNITALAKLTARLGGTLLLTIIFLLVGKNRPAGIIATAIIWIAFLITIFQ